MEHDLAPGADRQGVDDGAVAGADGGPDGSGGGRRQAIVSLAEFHDPEDVAAALPGMAMMATRIAPGPFHARFITIRLGDILLESGTSPPAIARIVANPWASVLQLPLANRATLRLNGRDVGEAMVGLYGGGAELLRANPQPASHVALVLPMERVGALICASDRLPIAQPRADGLMQAEAGAWDRLARIAGAAAGIAAAAPDDLALPAAREGLRASLLDAARLVLASCDERMPARLLRAHRGWTRIVSSADACLEADAARPIYTEDLCARLGVSPASLAEAFRNVLGTTPHRYLKLRRLAMVRAALRVQGGPPPLIKTVALSHGFWHLGQFAHDYRAMFGETASATLARARGWSAEPAAMQGSGAPDSPGRWRRAS